MPSAGTPRLIESLLREHLAPLRLEIIDESRFHAGHAGATEGGGHYAVTVVSAAFEGLGSAQRHRLVYRVLAAQMHTAIHALAIRALTPAEWESGAGGSAPPSTRP